MRVFFYCIVVKKSRRTAEDNEGKFAITMGSRYFIVQEKFEEYIDSFINGEREDEPDEQIDSLRERYFKSEWGDWTIRTQQKKVL